MCTTEAAAGPAAERSTQPDRITAEMHAAPSPEAGSSQRGALHVAQHAPYGCGCSEAWFWREYDHARIWSPRSAYPWSARWLLAYRVFSALWWSGILAYTFGRKFTMERDETPWRHMVFWTNQSLLFMLLYFLCSSLCGIVALRCSSVHTSRDAFEASLLAYPRRAHAWWVLLRLTRLLYQISVSWETTIVIMFWAVLASPSNYDSEHWFLNIVQHMLGIVFLLADTLCGCMRPQDRVYAGAFGSVLVYLLINYVVTAATNDPVYTVLSWKSGLTGALVVLAALLVTLMHYLYVLLAWARDRCVQATWTPAQQYALFSALLASNAENYAIKDPDMASASSNATAMHAAWRTWYPSIFSDELAAYPLSQCLGPSAPCCRSYRASYMTCVPCTVPEHRLVDVRTASSSADATSAAPLNDTTAQPQDSSEETPGTMIDAPGGVVLVAVATADDVATGADKQVDEIHEITVPAELPGAVNGASADKSGEEA